MELPCWLFCIKINMLLRPEESADILERAGADMKVPTQLFLERYENEGNNRT